MNGVLKTCAILISYPTFLKMHIFWINVLCDAAAVALDSNPVKITPIWREDTTLQIHTAERQWKCSETTVILKKYSGLPQTMLHCIFYQ